MRHLITAAVICLPLACLADIRIELAGDLEADTSAKATKVTSKPSESSPESDMMRFINHDTLHGTFHSFGKDNTMHWKSPEATELIPFSTKKIHRILLNQGHGHASLQQSSTVTLVNGDVIPGRITSADQKSIILETEHLGTLTLPNDAVSQISPCPFGGQLLYYGPLSPEGWKTILPPKPKVEEIKEAEKHKNKDINEKAEKKAEDRKGKDWQHIASAWYSGTDKNQYLARKNALTDKCRLAFKLGWRGSLYCNVAIHADFAPPEYEGKDSSSRGMAAIVGHAYVVSLSTHSATLYTCSFDEDGKPSNIRNSETHTSLSLSGKEEANFEFRIDRPNKQLLLYLNDVFKTKWDLGEKYHGTGNTLAFSNLRYSNAELRVSDIVISRWNGLKDSAQSMTSSESDVILLTNGVDRFSGKFNNIRDGKVSFRGCYNNDFSIPVDEVQEIHLATDKLRKMPDEDNDKSTYFYVQPYGRISGIPSAGENGMTKLISNILGEINLNTRYVNIIDFSHHNSLLDLWDDNF